MKTRYYILFLWLFTACGISENEQKSKIELSFNQVDQLLSEKLMNRQFNGNVLIAYGDSVFMKSYGYSRMKNEMALEIGNIFYLGSLAKQFTAMAIMVLAEDQKLTLDDPLTQYIDSLPDICRDITIRHMLNHTSGLPDYYSMGIYESGMTNRMVVEAMQQLEALDFEPGTSYKYSNSAYVLLSEIVSQVANTSFRDFLKTEIFEPLDMKNSIVYDESKPMIPLRALGHSRNGSLNDYNAFTTGGGGIFSNLEDLYKWVRGLDNGKLVSEPLMEMAYSPVQLNDSTTSWYGFGWRLSEEYPKVVQHSGSLVGYRTYMFRNLETGTVVILLSNFTDNVSEINQEILQILNEPI